MADIQYTSVIQPVLDRERITVDALQPVINGLTWKQVVHDAAGTPHCEMPMMQGDAINQVVRVFGLRPVAVAVDGVIQNFGVLGIETPHQRIYLLDVGDKIVPIGIENMESPDRPDPDARCPKCFRQQWNYQGGCYRCQFCGNEFG